MEAVTILLFFLVKAPGVKSYRPVEEKTNNKKKKDEE